jgi:hypothetical protein
MTQLTNRSPLDFEVKTKKPSQWFSSLNHQTVAAGFKAQTRKPSTTLVLRLNQETHHWFWGQTGRNHCHRFWGQTRENRRLWFWGQIGENCPSGFEHWQTAPMILRPHHWQTVHLGFESQPRNSRSSSPLGRCRPHIASPDLSIAQAPSTRPVRSPPILCTRSPTHTTILVTARHAAPATFTPRGKQTQFSK